MRQTVLARRIYGRHAGYMGCAAVFTLFEWLQYQRAACSMAATLPRWRQRARTAMRAPQRQHGASHVRERVVRCIGTCVRARTRGASCWCDDGVLVCLRCAPALHTASEPRGAIEGGTAGSGLVAAHERVSRCCRSWSSWLVASTTCSPGIHTKSKTSHLVHGRRLKYDLSAANTKSHGPTHCLEVSLSEI